MAAPRRRTFLKTAGLIAGGSTLGVGGWWGTASAGSSARRIEQVRVFERLTEGYHTFRTPAIVRATDGTLLAFAGAHVNDAEDWGHIDLVLRRSTDGGRTWGRLQIAMADPPNKVANHVPVVDRTTGRIHLFCVRTAGDVTGDDIINGDVSPQDAPRPFVLHSDDHGATWSQPVEITDDVKLPDMRHYVGGPGHGIQLTKGEYAGRLLLPGNHTVLPPDGDQPPVVGTHLTYSDDGGRTWHVGAIDRHDDGLVHPNETTLVELADGTVYANTRDHGGSAPGNRAATTSSDGGTTFDAPFRIVDDLETPIVHGSLLERPNGSERVLFSAPGHPTSRERLTIWSSRDGAESWRKSLLLYDGPAGYSDLVEVDDGETSLLGVIYENGPRLSDQPYLSYHQWNSFARIPLSALDRPIPAQPTTPDTSGQGNQAVVGGNPREVEGVFGTALELAGDYVEVPYNDSIAVADKAFTVALWFRTSDQRVQRLVHAYNYNESPQLLLEVATTAVRGQVITDEASPEKLVREGTFIDGEWHHVALTRDEAALTLYVDGMPTTGAPVPGSVSAGALGGIRIGVRADGINHPLAGAVDEVHLFDEALTAEQIDTLRTSNTGPGGTAVFHLPLNEVR